MGENELLQCYNRGCGLKFNPKENDEKSCQHHPGDPVFHDAYKGWSCCNKKCTDFTEFLNIKGCTFSIHSNVKPPEPEKQAKTERPEEVIEVKPLVKPTLQRPPFETPLTNVKPEIAASLRSEITPSVNATAGIVNKSDEVVVGTACKNGGCTVSYAGPETNETPCVHHPGCPIFHEGLKFWSCCQKRTSDFNAFLNQIGCETSKHLWIKQDENEENVKCRWDFHQTGTHVIVSIYAKQYSPDDSYVKLNPIRMCANIVFPQQNNAAFNMDVELRGVIDVENSRVNMYGTKVEIKLKKAEPGSWAKLDVPRQAVKPVQEKPKVETLEAQVESVDLSDL